MSVNVQNASRMKLLEELKDKMNRRSRQCSTIMANLKSRGIDISGIANMGLSQEEMKMVATYFTFKNEQINLSCDVKAIENEEMDSQTRNRELNQLEADRKIQARKQEEERQREIKQNEERAAAEKSWYENNRTQLEEAGRDTEPER